MAMESLESAMSGQLTPDWTTYNEVRNHYCHRCLDDLLQFGRLRASYSIFSKGFSGFWQFVFVDFLSDGVGAGRDRWLDVVRIDKKLGASSRLDQMKEFCIHVLHITIKVAYNVHASILHIDIAYTYCV